MDPIQNPLFREPIGESFRLKREQLGLSLDDAAKQLRFGAHFLQAIELEQWDKLGPPIFAKSYINSYAKLLGINDSIRDGIPSMPSTPNLKAITPVKVESARGGAKWLLAAACLAAVVGAVYYFNRGQVPNESMKLDSLIAVPAAKPAAVDKPATDGMQSSSVAIPASPSAAPPATVPANPEFKIKAVQNNWLKVVAKDNSVLFSAELKAGQEYTQKLDAIGQITLGNASTAEVSIGGVAQDIRALIRDDVARFTIGSDGQPAALTQ
jgi:cytoskeleton protein RodZ